MDALERAQATYDLFASLRAGGVAPCKCVAGVAARLDRPVFMVRRDLALAKAPEAVRELVRTGELAARTAVLMQGLPAAEQLVVAQRVRGMRSTRAAQYHVLESLKVRALAKTVERTLVDVVGALEELMDLPSRRLADIYRITSDGVGRRSLSALIERIIEQGTELKQALPDSAIKKEVVVNG